MNLETLRNNYETYKNKVAAYGLAQNSIHFDLATSAPEDGKPYLGEMSSILSGEIFSYITDAQNVKMIEDLRDTTDDPLEKQECELRLRDLYNTVKIPKDIYIDYQLELAKSQRIWEEAKETNNWPLFKDELVTVINKTKKLHEYYNIEGSVYDFMLDQFQIGMNTKKYDAFFQTIKDELVPFIKKLKETTQIDDAPLFGSFPSEKQAQFTEILKETLAMDPKKIYITESIHPFTSFFSSQDARFTTRYHENSLMSAILSTIHEYGHALYVLQVNPAYERTTFFSSIGFAMHESQSRLLENHVGRAKGFWQLNYPSLQALFNDDLKDVTFDAFMKMINKANPSLIRIEADELTYPLHILIRYELEKMIFNEDIDLDNLDVLWADKYEEYLGVRPSNASEGILQDMHWSAAYFGYFPTYALGSAFAAQFYNQMDKDFDVQETIAQGNFTKVQDWLATNIHQYGASKTSDEIIQEVCGEPFDAHYYTDYLIKKFSRLYNI
ncbi:carboxypeptidase Taq [Breznakia blatticola]|uniref:Metal-dependent carboxypeptidase n=1 Tax=Breznakia blatticola TaxID=1754012 RepID=A0A4R7ZFK4_9FIRM|nr:carboxypeptidase M32 [Breznakia blatticola]TDW16082.1 carboxypeptidase Taq [Breznakia blatticola]